jgi:hypothetical protein
LAMFAADSGRSFPLSTAAWIEEAGELMGWNYHRARRVVH